MRAAIDRFVGHVRKMAESEEDDAVLEKRLGDAIEQLCTAVIDEAVKRITGRQ